MAGTTEPDSEESQGIEGCSFEWDDKSQLYYHASSGFYHDPSAGWYYNSRDGLYYKFENENYVPLGSDQGDQSETYLCMHNVPENSVQDDPNTHVHSHKDVDYSFQGRESEACELGSVSNEPSTDHIECNSSQMPGCPPPPSEWLEDTLIDLYLSGYSNQAIDAVEDVKMPMETDDGDSLGNDDTHELEEGEWIPDEDHGVNDSSGSVSDEGPSWEEENWRAQYGQVIHTSEESVPNVQVVDLWDWAMVTGTRKDGKSQVVRLVGRLVRKSARLHPSVPSGGGRLKTAPISEVHLDLVRVTSGQVYKLRNPGARYLASLSTYDSMNPTIDWGFPELSIDRQIQTLPVSSGNCEKMTKGVLVHKDLPSLPSQLAASKTPRGSAYRDRAAERRALHGGFGVGPGQKKSTVTDDSVPLSDVSPEEAAGEALNNSFGAGSYARRILESMGWKEGEALGSSSKGLIEPLQAVGNKGNAGLGWDQSRRYRV
ncbi:D111/G-patch domain-containing protein [Actinidia rufa]|uniref:D111/G-patch domain-containing protein n=1 Tax=Actinidia rufa TaxID=165716 RepID=A0A7J0GAJ2_9ERIC|nr:D111/G-patch domain-containing protein [Actinidia rufa]